MLELTYIGEEAKYKVDFDIVTKNIVKIIGDLPEKSTGFILNRENEEDNWDYSAYTTVYSKEPGFILFSNDGSTKPLPIEIIDKNIYFHCSGGGSIKGETKQLVEDYSELEVPEAIAEDNYDFVGWMPDIPSEGEIDITNTNFYAVFESNIPNRVEMLESDLTDTQVGLVENYDFALNTAEEVTDLQLAMVENYDTALATAEEVTNLQLALVEVYELFLGGM